jgi:hypothetical protein
VAEDADDVAALARFAKRHAKGEDETIPVAVLAKPAKVLDASLEELIGHKSD